ncbi:MAG: tetratricopeptide repeat protein [Chitinispirillaceae bacterium]|nr:tetratricopeptide repeat protein [Chitinispirillaceae bacterium]
MQNESINELFLKAQMFKADGDRQKALSILREIVRREPENAGAYSNIGMLLHEIGDVNGALEAFRQSIAINPGLAEVHCNCGTAYFSLGNLAEAENSFNKAVELKPGLTAAMLGLGMVQQAAGDLEAAKKTFVDVLRRNPNDPSGHFFLGVIMRQWDRLDMAARCFRNALNFKPDFSPAYSGLGETLQASGLIDESEKCFRRAIELDPSNNIAYSNLFLSMNYNPCCTQEQILAESRKWGDELVKKTEKREGLPLFHNSRDPDRKLRIGYLSPDFCRHPVASFLEPLLKNHDPSLFQIFCYSYGRIQDQHTTRFMSYADQWRDIRKTGDDEARRLIYDDRIDILVDCAGHMADNRLTLLARPCAPIQVSWIGYPNTTGLTTVDYRFGDEITDPVAGKEWYVEKLVRLPECFCCYGPPENAPEVSDLPGEWNGYVTFGSLHTLARLNSAVIALWSEVMTRLPSSRLIIFRTVVNDEIVERLREQFKRHSVDPERIEFVREVPAEGHLSLYHRIDIALDTFPWSGHTTACEALWMGVPVITLSGSRHASRMVASVLTRLGIDDFIAESETDFLTIAKRTAQELASLAMLRKGLRELMQTSRLCDAVSFTRNVEHEYRKMWMKKQW